MTSLAEEIGNQLSRHSFRSQRRPRLAESGVVTLWQLRTWNLNRAVALVNPVSPVNDLARFCQTLKWTVARDTFLIPSFYEVGLQIVIAADGLRDLWKPNPALPGLVDRISNQIVVLQSVFTVDTAHREYHAVRTWGQVVTGRFQDAIEDGIRSAGFRAGLPSGDEG